MHARTIFTTFLVGVVLIMSVNTFVIYQVYQRAQAVYAAPAAAAPTAAPAAPTAPAAPAVLPTAHIVSTPSVAEQIVVAAPTPTSAPAATAPTSTTTTLPRVRGPVVWEGPGGLPHPLRLGEVNFGAVAHLYYTDRDTTLQVARQAGFGWVRQQVHWRDVEDRSGELFWDEVDNIVEAAERNNVLVLLSVVRAPTWYTDDGSDGMPSDPRTLARFLGAMAERYQGRVHAIEVWNEQNLAHETGGRISLDDAGRYVELLAASYNAIKAVSPEMIVVVGAPSPTSTNIDTIAVPDLDYMRAMYSYKDGMIRDYFDVQALHPIGTINPPDKLYPEDPHTAVGWTDDETFYFRHIENARAVMEEAGLAHHQVWITEFGWATQNNSPGYEYGNHISFEMQRDYIVGAMQRTVEHYPWVSNMFVWNLNFTVVQKEAGVDPLHEQGSFSIVNEDWTPRPSYTGIQEFIARQRAQ